MPSAGYVLQDRTAVFFHLKSRKASLSFLAAPVHFKFCDTLQCTIFFIVKRIAEYRTYNTIDGIMFCTRKHRHDIDVQLSCGFIFLWRVPPACLHAPCSQRISCNASWHGGSCVVWGIFSSFICMETRSARNSSLYNCISLSQLSSRFL